MSLPAEAGAAALNAPTARALDLLRGYLEEIEFIGLHKYASSPWVYPVNPNFMNWRQRAAMVMSEAYVEGTNPELGLALGLMVDAPVRIDAIPPRLADLAAALVAGGLLVAQGEHYRMGGLQLISMQSMPLLLDHRLGFGGPNQLHDVYVGPDSALLSYYVDTEALGPGARGLDLGTGTGVLALYLSRFCGHVTATDIMPAPLWLAGVNRRLNAAERRLEIRRESYIDTIARGERYDVVSFNPPFVALPDEMAAPVYAKGIGADGLDYCRMLVELFHEVVAPGGVAYIVADMLGDTERPFFVAELEGYAPKLGLAIDVFIDSRLDLRGEDQLPALARGLSYGNPTLQPGAIMARLRELQLDELRADCTFCTVMVLRRAGSGGAHVHVYNRYR